MTDASEKACRDCGAYYPDTADHFRKRKDGSLDSRCLICRRKMLAGKRQKERVRSLRDIEVGAVSQFMKSATAGGENIPHSSELLERLMEYFGGTSGFSALLVKQYFDSPPGGAARTKMLESMLRLVVKNTDMGGAKKPMGQWTDDELEAELDNRLKAVAAQFQGRIIDGTISKKAASPAPAAIGVEGGVVPSGPAEGASGRGRRKKNRSPKAVSANTDAGADARLPSE